MNPSKFSIYVITHCPGILATYSVICITNHGIYNTMCIGHRQWSDEWVHEKYVWS